MEFVSFSSSNNDFFSSFSCEKNNNKFYTNGSINQSINIDKFVWKQKTNKQTLVVLIIVCIY